MLAAVGSNLFAGYGGGIYKSTDNGVTWTQPVVELNVYSFAVVGTNIFAGTEYGVLLSTDNGTNWSGQSNGLTYSSICSFAAMGTYLYAGSLNGHVYRLSLASLLIPEPPVLTYPADTATDIALNPKLTWIAPVGATSYTLQIATDAGFSTIIVNQTGIAAPYYNVTGLALNTAYYWRVKATNTAGTSSWGSTWGFTTTQNNVNATILNANTVNASIQVNTPLVNAADVILTHQLSAPTITSTNISTDHLNALTVSANVTATSISTANLWVSNNLNGNNIGASNITGADIEATNLNASTITAAQISGGDGEFSGTLTPAKLGVGMTSSPAGDAKLEVSGMSLFNGGNANLGNLTNLSFLQNSAKMLIGWNRTAGEGEADFISNRSSTTGTTGGFAFYDIDNSGSLRQIMRIVGNGDVHVDGTIGCRELVVTLGTWPDYVFKPGYQLMPLVEVEKYIKQENHLPGIPDQEKATKQGVSVGEMQAKLLQKIEELTLYMIQMKKENQDLKERLSRVEKKANAEEK
ncbi:MAG: hypothetical protein PHC61_00750 [Chitinivibrionales bacterium]|nr:hypothetical protein [Chitinivibrionales bacterium]